MENSDILTATFLYFLKPKVRMAFGSGHSANLDFLLKHDADLLLFAEKEFSQTKSLSTQLKTIERQLGIIEHIDHIVFAKKARLQAILKALREHVQKELPALHRERGTAPDDFQKQAAQVKIHGYNNMINEIDALRRKVTEVQRKTLKHTQHIVSRA